VKSKEPEKPVEIVPVNEGIDYDGDMSVYEYEEEEKALPKEDRGEFDDDLEEGD
jgi:hypothetical protein